MIYSLRVKNFRCLEDFAVEFSRQNLLLGKNGSGKSTIFDAITVLRSLVVDRKEVGDCLKYFLTKTRWTEDDSQLFQIRIGSADEVFDYSVEIEFALAQPNAGSKIVRESLDLQRSSGERLRLFESKVEPELGLTATLFGNDGVSQMPVLASALRSGIGALDLGPATETIWRFRVMLEDVLIVRAIPQFMPSFSNEATTKDANLRHDLYNFAPWFRRWEAVSPNAGMQLTASLSAIWPELTSVATHLLPNDVGLLETKWQVDGKAAVTFYLDELSDGQRALLGLYAVLTSLQGKSATLCLDEPDNYLALAELQPLLRAFEQQDGLQTLIVSHHPEVIDQWAVDRGLHFRRKAGGNCEVKAFTAAAGDVPLRASEIVALGWDDG